VEDASSTDFLAGMYREQQGKGMVQGGTDDGQLVDAALTNDELDDELDDDCENVEPD
jgi:DNA ligase-1